MPKTLLLADDSVTIQKVVGISLANEDIELVTVENGDDAVTQAQEVRPDIVLADIVMPGKNGYEVCEAVKTDPNLAATPVLLLTGTFEAFDAERARQVGADGHITKPFEAQALVDQVNQLLARSTPLGGESVPAAPPNDATAPVTNPPADVGTHGEGGDAFDFFDGQGGDADNSWPTSPGHADAAGLDLVAGPGAGNALAQADETVLLDPGQGSGDPAFDAAVDAAAFDAPGERTPFQAPDDSADDSGFDLESADLSMAATVPEVPVASSSMSFSDIAPEATPDAAQEVEATPITDPLLDFDPIAEVAPLQGQPLVGGDPGQPLVGGDRGLGNDIEVFSSEPDPIEAIPVQSFAEPTADVTQPGTDLLDAGADTVMIVEDANPVRVQSPGDADTTAPVSVPVGVGGGTPQISPALEQHLHATLEKIAWEAFSDLSEKVVQQVLGQVEAVAWEVIPRMTEILVKEEISKMKGGESEED